MTLLERIDTDRLADVLPDIADRVRDIPIDELLTAAASAAGVLAGHVENVADRTRRSNGTTRLVALVVLVVLGTGVIVMIRRRRTNRTEASSLESDQLRVGAANPN